MNLKAAQSQKMTQQVISATLKIIRESGVKDVTVRRVAEELGGSTTVVTHYFANRGVLLESVVSDWISATKHDAQDAIDNSDDKLWGFLVWSISPEHQVFWQEFFAAHMAGIDTEIFNEIEQFLTWWDEQLLMLLKDRVKPGRNVLEVSDIIGVVIEGLLFSGSRSLPSGLGHEELLKITIEPLLVKLK
jgi:AcrR family transcriptional regulator